MLEVVWDLWRLYLGKVLHLGLHLDKDQLLLEDLGDLCLPIRAYIGLVRWVVSWFLCVNINDSN